MTFEKFHCVSLNGYRIGLYELQEALFNVGLHVNFIALAHLSYFPTS